MPSPYSKELEELMSTISGHLDSKLGTSTPNEKKASSFNFGIKISEKYAKIIPAAYAAVALGASVLWTRARAPKTPEGKTKMSIAKVLMWWIVFCLPLIMYVYYRPVAA